MYSVLTSATQLQRENFCAAVRALAKEGKPLSVQDMSAEEAQKHNVDLGNQPQKRNKPVSSGGRFECGKKGHYAKHCHAKRQASTIKKDSRSTTVLTGKSQGPPRICYSCRKEGHYISQCPQRYQPLTPDARMPEVVSIQMVTLRADGNAVGPVCPAKQSKKRCLCDDVTKKA